MNKYFFSILIVFLLSLSSCADDSQSGSSYDKKKIPNKQEIQNIKDSSSKDSRQETSVFPIEIGTIDRSEPRLFGCGTSLWQIETNPNQDGVLFSHKDKVPLMVFNDKIINLKKAIVSSQVDEENYGTFTTEDGSISVQVDLTMGELLSYESRSISKGTITITTQGQTKDIDVVGVWGC